MNLKDVLRFALELSITVPAAAVALLPVRDHLRVAKKTMVWITAALLFVYVGLGAVLCEHFYWRVNVYGLPALLAFLAVYLVLVDLRLTKKLFCFFNASMLASFASLLARYLSAPLEADNSAITARVGTGFIYLGVVIAVGAVFYRTLMKKLPELLEDERLNFAWRFLQFVPLLLTVLFIWVSPSPEEILYGRNLLVGVATMSLFPLGLLTLYHVFWLEAAHFTESARLQQQNELLRLEQKRYEQLRLYLDESRAMRHDSRQHLVVMSELARAGRTEELQKYLSQLTDAAAQLPVRLCANAASDAVAGKYDAMAREQGAEILWSLDLPETLPIPEADFCPLFGNLLENAVRAVSKLPQEQRKIFVTARLLSEEMLGLTVKNPYAGEIRFDRNGLPRAEREGHGVGLVSVAGTVRRYRGSMEFRTDGGVFAVNVLLCSA